MGENDLCPKCDAVHDWLSPIQEMDEEGFQAFVEGISTKSWSRILKIVNAIDERETPQEDKSKKIIKLLHSKGLCVVAESLAEPITDARLPKLKTLTY